jgi:hypothetical protein
MNISEMVLAKLKEHSPQGKLDHTAMIILALASVNHQSVKGHLERVALLCDAVAKELHKDTNAAFFAGLLHDTGKLTEPHPLFDGHNVSEAEYKEIKEHVFDGFNALKRMHHFTALCAGIHHSMCQNGYGLTLEEFPKNWHNGTIKKIMEISGILAICDFIDAFTHRETKIRDGSDKESQDLRTMLLKKYPEDEMTIDIALRKNTELSLVN